MSYPTHLTRVESDIRRERETIEAKWGQQNHPDGTGIIGDAKRARTARETCQYAASKNDLTWRDVLWEEVAEALAETDPSKLRAELVQVAAVAQEWIDAIDRRGSGGTP